MYNKLLKAKTIEDRDVWKGRIEAEEDFKSIIDAVVVSTEKINELKAYFAREDSKRILVGRMLETTDERLENKIIARVEHFEKLKKAFLKNPQKYV